MYKAVIDVEPLEKYKLKLTFEGNEIRIFDVSPYLDYGVFTELKDKSLFNSVHVSFDTIEWLNGADLDPEELYENSYAYSADIIG